MILNVVFLQCPWWGGGFSRGLRCRGTSELLPAPKCPAAAETAPTSPDPSGVCLLFYSSPWSISSHFLTIRGKPLGKTTPHLQEKPFLLEVIWIWATLCSLGPTISMEFQACKLSVRWFRIFWKFEGQKIISLTSQGFSVQWDDEYKLFKQVVLGVSPY